MSHGGGSSELASRIGLRGGGDLLDVPCAGHADHGDDGECGDDRDGPDERVLQISESAADALAESLSLAASGIVEPSRRVLFDQIQTAARRVESSADTDALLESIPSEIWQSSSEAEKQRLVSVAREGTPLFVVVASFEITSFDEEFFLLRAALEQLGEVIATSPTVDPQHSDRVNFRVLYASSVSSAELQSCMAGYAGEITQVERDATSDSIPGQSVVAAPNTASASALTNFVRTDLARLDQLISSTHELFRTTANALSIASAQKQTDWKAREELQSLDETIRRSFRELENELINLRMVSLGATLQRAMRTGRTVARASGKEIDFEVSGKHLRVDKVLADSLADPLIHLIRNAVDHGIELTAERTRLGKERGGKIRIEAISEGAQTRVRVSDDGRGINPELISAAAARLGIVTEPAQLDFERSVRLIFRAGFSTLASATAVSGRGVGLDVVETAVEQVGGELRVSSRLGAGTTFEIRLPVTFGLLSATVLVSNGNRYCIPTDQVVNIGEVAREKRPVKRAQNQPHDEPVNLAKILGKTAPTKATKSTRQVTCQLSESRQEANESSPRELRLIVDKVEGNEEILVRSLGRHGGRWYGVAGATELRDGSVALVLDLARLLSSS